ncbi:L-gulonolactone oxidase [Lamellibrachia satsuma]|nr:L-gulonolactone oxidase [Lamellibrachia satsuma]
MSCLFSGSERWENICCVLLCSIGAISLITLVGAVSTGVHGTGINYGIMSSYVQEVTLMKADGDVITVSRETDETTFLAACVSLGALGVILSVKVQCEPAFHLEQTRYGAKRKKVMEELDSYLTGSDHFHLMWYPVTDDCTVFETKRTKKPINRTRSWFWEVAVSFHLLQFLYWLSTFVPILLPAITWFCFTVLERQRQEIVDRSDRLFSFDCFLQQDVTEWAFPREKTASVMEELKQWIDKTGFKAHFPIEVRFVKADDIYLSPCCGQDSCYINILSYRPYGKAIPHDSYWKAYQDIVFKAGGRPHWAKDHTLTSDVLSGMYPGWQQFSSVRRRLDPNGMFTNAYVDRLLGASDASGSD